MSPAGRLIRLLPERAPSAVEAAAPLRLAAIFNQIETERQQLADLLNDDPVQILAHISRVLQGLQDTPEIPAVASKSAQEAGLLAAAVSEQLRALARRLRPPLLDDVGLETALAQLASDFSRSSGIAIRSDTGEAQASGPADVDLVFFRVAQEALRNAEKHSAATQVVLRLRRGGGRLRLAVWDNGIGLSDPPRHHFPGRGFLEMRERLRSVGGRLTVRSGASRGTLVLASAPGEGRRSDAAGCRALGAALPPGGLRSS